MHGGGAAAVHENPSDKPGRRRQRRRSCILQGVSRSRRRIGKHLLAGCAESHRRRYNKTGRAERHVYHAARCAGILLRGRRFGFLAHIHPAHALMVDAGVRSDGLHGQACRAASPGGHGAISKPGEHHRNDCKKAHVVKIGIRCEDAKSLSCGFGRCYERGGRIRSELGGCRGITVQVAQPL